MKPRSLYISYDGALDPLGQSQVIPYLTGLAKRGVQWTLLSFEKPSRFSDQDRREWLERRLKEAGIRWQPLKYHQRPSLPATLYDMLRGITVASRLVRESRLQVVHARSYVAATMALALKRLCGVPFIFDMRGFFAEERVAGGLWPAGGVLYRLTKLVEVRLLAEADQIVSLSEAGREVLENWARRRDIELPPVHVIPTCVDCSHFRLFPGPEKRSDGPTLLFFGSLTWYMVAEMLAFFGAFRRLRPKARFTFLTPSPPEAMYEAASALGIDGSALQVLGEVPYETVPEIIQGADASIFFRGAFSSMRATCPTKMGESLACGLPVVINPGVGDTEGLVRREQVGVIVSSWTEEAYTHAAQELLALLEEDSVLRQRCREVALRHFSLEVGIESYGVLYAKYSLRAPTVSLT